MLELWAVGVDLYWLVERGSGWIALIAARKVWRSKSVSLLILGQRFDESFLIGFQNRFAHKLVLALEKENYKFSAAKHLPVFVRALLADRAWFWRVREDRRARWPRSCRRQSPSEWALPFGQCLQSSAPQSAPQTLLELDEPRFHRCILHQTTSTLPLQQN